jgi:hypothetical protein
MKITDAIREIKTVDQALNYIRNLSDIYERRMAYQYLTEANIYLKSNDIFKMKDALSINDTSGEFERFNKTYLKERLGVNSKANKLIN